MYVPVYDLYIHTYICWIVNYLKSLCSVAKNFFIHMQEMLQMHIVYISQIVRFLTSFMYDIFMATY